MPKHICRWGLKDLVFGAYFDQTLEGVDFPESLVSWRKDGGPIRPTRLGRRVLEIECYPWKPTWNLKMMVWKSNFFSTMGIFGVHVGFWGWFRVKWLVGCQLRCFNHPIYHTDLGHQDAPCLMVVKFWVKQTQMHMWLLLPWTPRTVDILDYDTRFGTQFWPISISLTALRCFRYAVVVFQLQE